MQNSSRRKNEGFTLVELLIVIVILGILATVTVFAVTGITNRGKTSACAADHKTLVSAESAYEVEHSGYGTMTELVSGGRLHTSSTLFTVAVNPAGDAYTLSGVGECATFLVPAGGGGGGAVGSVSGVADSITFAGMSALSYAAPGATRTIVIIDNGLQFGQHDSLDDFNGRLSSPPEAGINLVLVDLATAVDSNVVTDEAAAVDAIIATNPALIATYRGAHSTETNDTLIARHQFALGASYSMPWGIQSVVGFYHDYVLGEAGGTAITYGGIPAVRYGSATATHNIVVLPYGLSGDGINGEFATLSGLPADLSVTMVGLIQTNSVGTAYPEWWIDAVLAQRPDVVAAPSDMQVFNSGSGSSVQDIELYVADNHLSPTFFSPLDGPPLSGKLLTIYATEGWG